MKADQAVRSSDDLVRFAFPAMVAFAAASFAQLVLRDGDTYWHVRTGEWILDHRTVPVADIYSFTFAGKAWHVHEWLAEVFFALAYRGAGWSGVMLLTGVAAGLIFGLLYQWLRRHIDSRGALIALFLVALCLIPSILARPFVLALALLVIWMRVLLDARAAGRTPSPIWLLLIVLWVNMHGSVLLAVALIGPFALEALVEQRADWRKVVRDWGLFGVGAVAATLITPRGIDGLLFLVQLTRMESLAHIAEWAPPNFAKPGGLEILLFAGLFCLLWRGVRIPPIRIGVLLIMLHLALLHYRHQTVFAIVATMICCEALGRMRQPNLRQQADTPLPAPDRRKSIALIGAAFLGISAVRLALPAGVPESRRSPATGLAQVPAQLRSQPVLNSYDFGALLIWNGVRPFIDSRTDLYGDDFYPRYNAISHDKPGEVERALKDYGITWTFLATGRPAALRLDRLKGWRRLYSDELVTIHVRTESGPAPATP